MLIIELITDAFRELGVIDAYSEPSAEDATLALRKLNTLMLTLEHDTIELGYFPQTDVNAELPITDLDASLVMPLFAMALKINFPATQVSPELAGWAMTCRDTMLRNAVIANAEVARPAIPMGSSITDYDINRGS